MFDFSIMALFVCGLAAVIAAIHRVLLRAGVGFDGIIEVSKKSSDQRKADRDKYWKTIFDKKSRGDQIMLAVGGGSVIVSVVIMNMIAK